MQTKTFEIRDRGTFIPVIATKIQSSGNLGDTYLLHRAGFISDFSAYKILLCFLEKDEAHIDPFKWEGLPLVRTMFIAHQYLEEHFDLLQSGTVVDVEYILGESSTIKSSERFNDNSIYSYIARETT